MAVRLSKIAREFNVGLSTIVEFLHSKGKKISSDPNAKLTDEEYALVAKEFSSDSEVKKESSLVDLKNTRKKKETVSIDESGNVSTENEETSPEDEFISVKDEVKLESKIKIVDRIDLNPERKHVQQEEKTKEQEEKDNVAPVQEKNVVTEVAEIQKETDNQEESEKETEMPGDNNENTPFKVVQPTLKEVKVVGSIDLDAINQRTRPPKKSKQEKERDRREQKKNLKPKQQRPAARRY